MRVIWIVVLCWVGANALEDSTQQRLANKLESFRHHIHHHHHHRHHRDASFEETQGVDITTLGVSLTTYMNANNRIDPGYVDASDHTADLNWATNHPDSTFDKQWANTGTSGFVYYLLGATAYTDRITSRLQAKWDSNYKNYLLLMPNKGDLGKQVGDAARKTWAINYFLTLGKRFVKELYWGFHDLQGTQNNFFLQALAPDFPAAQTVIEDFFFSELLPIMALLYPGDSRDFTAAVDLWTGRDIVLGMHRTQKFIDFFDEMTTNIYANRADIYTTFLQADFGQAIDDTVAAVWVSRFEVSSSDPHNGKRVAFFNIGVDHEDDDGSVTIMQTNIVYKPRSVSIDRWFVGDNAESFLSKFNGWAATKANTDNNADAKAALPLMQTTYKSYADFGFVEYVNPDVRALSDDEANLYYYRAGMLQAGLMAMGYTDVHQGNVFRVGSHPVPVDLEIVDPAQDTGLADGLGKNTEKSGPFGLVLKASNPLPNTVTVSSSLTLDQGKLLTKFLSKVEDGYKFAISVLIPKSVQFQAHLLAMSQDNTCIVRVHPAPTPDLTRRVYLLSLSTSPALADIEKDAVVATFKTPAKGENNAMNVALNLALFDSMVQQLARMDVPKFEIAYADTAFAEQGDRANILAMKTALNGENTWADQDNTNVANNLLALMPGGAPQTVTLPQSTYQKVLANWNNRLTNGNNWRDQASIFSSSLAQ